jgi:hypothetical protein
LGCSIYDFILEPDSTKKDIITDVQKIVYQWCCDDNGKNILYKKSGEERYPDFKLYKMIARTVHKHTPANQLSLPYFKQYEISKKDIPKTNVLIVII